MFIALHQRKLSYIRRLSVALVLLGFLGTVVIPSSLAQEIFPTPGTMVALSSAYFPAQLLGLRTHKENPFRLDFILDTGQNKLSPAQVNAESLQLIKYFLTALTVPENDLWVNLSPYEKNRIIPDELSQTAMGKELLLQDYFLKQLSSSLSYPENELGKKFWERVFAETKKQFGTMEIPVNTFNRVWIVPDKAVVYENDGVVFIGESHLKVMLEEDYQSLNSQRVVEVMASRGALSIPSDVAQRSSVVGASATAPAMTSKIFRETVLPSIEKEVNEGQNFAKLRQIYRSMILAAWYKQVLKDGLLGRLYVDSKRIAGIDIPQKDIKEKIFAQYIESFKKGAYSLIKEEVDPLSGEDVPRKYFSGGFEGKVNNILDRRASSGLMLPDRIRRKLAAGLAILLSVVLISPPRTAIGATPLESGDEVLIANPVAEKFSQKSAEEQKLAERRERWLSLADKNYQSAFERAQEFINEPFAYEVLEKAAFAETSMQFKNSIKTALGYLDNYIDHPRVWELLDLILKLYPSEGYSQIGEFINKPYGDKFLDMLVKHRPDKMMSILLNGLRWGSTSKDQIVKVLEKSQSPVTKKFLEILATNHDLGTKEKMTALLDSLVRGELSVPSAAEIVKNESKFIETLVTIMGRKDYLSSGSIDNEFYYLSRRFSDSLELQLGSEGSKKIIDDMPLKNVIYLISYLKNNIKKVDIPVNHFVFERLAPQLRNKSQIFEELSNNEKAFYSFLRSAAEFDRLEEILSGLDSVTVEALLKHFIEMKEQGMENGFSEYVVGSRAVLMTLASDLLQRSDTTSQKMEFYQQVFKQARKELRAVNDPETFLRLSDRFLKPGFVSELIDAEIIKLAQMNPEYWFFSHTSKFIGRSIGPEAFIMAAKNNPADALRPLSDQGIRQILQKASISDPAIKALLDIMMMKYDANSGKDAEIKKKIVLLFDKLATGEMTIEQARDLVGHPFAFLQELVRIQAKPDHLGDYSLAEYISDFCLRMVRQINNLHARPDAIRFKSIEQVAALDLYILMVQGEQEIFTSSFNGIFDRMLAKMKDSGVTGDKLLQQVGYNRFRSFVRLLTGFGRLNDFLATMDSAAKKEFINKFARDIEKEKNVLEQAVVVAETFGMIKDKEVLMMLQKIVHEEYDRVASQGHEEGVILYGLLGGFFGQDALVDVDWFKEMAQKYPLLKVSGIPSNKLFNARGENIQQHFFYYDEDGDGQRSFEHFIASYKNDNNWKIYSEKNYVRIVGSESGKKVIMLANKPLKAAQDKGVEDIAAYLKVQGMQRHMVVHRGHSFHVEKTVVHIQATDIVVSLGSCGGFNNVAKVLERAPQAHIFSTKGTGTMYVNGPLLKSFNNAILRGDIDWASYWKAAEKSISSAHFNLYVAPHKNLGALFIKTYNDRLKLLGKATQKVSSNDSRDYSDQEVVNSSLLSQVANSYVRVANAGTLSAEDFGPEFMRMYTLMTTWAGRFDLIAFYNDFGQEKGLPPVSQVVSAIAQHGMLKEYNAAVDGSLGQKLATGLETVAASSALENNPGGIDLDAGKLNLEIKRNAPPSLAPRSSGFEKFIQIDGLAPMIINVTPITNLPMILGLLEGDVGSSNPELVSQ